MELSCYWFSVGGQPLHWEQGWPFEDPASGFGGWRRNAWSDICDYVCLTVLMVVAAAAEL